MEKKVRHGWPIVAVLLMLLSSIAAGFLGYLYREQSQKNIALESELTRTKEEYASTSAYLLTSIASLNLLLATTTEEKNKLEENLRSEQELIGAMQHQVEAVYGTVGTLEKLNNTDRELLKKYSRVYFLNEHYAPKALTPIPTQYTFQTDKEKRVLADVLPFLLAMQDAGERDGVLLRVLSAYRSFGEQSALKSAYSVLYGAGTANKFSADQGYSEHQLGTTVDFTTNELGAKFSAFEKESAYSWLSANAYRYGFVLSYPKKNTYYVFEPWHWRFVGKDLAAKLHREHVDFYDLEQRDIDQYLVSIFDN